MVLAGEAEANDLLPDTLTLRPLRQARATPPPVSAAACGYRADAPPIPPALSPADIAPHPLVFPGHGRS